MIFKRKVQLGTRTGRAIGFPTLNFTVGDFGKFYKPGVYACRAIIEKVTYDGALYFGKKMSGRSKVLEIFVFNFSKRIYGDFVRFTVGKKIRGPKKFTDLGALKAQIGKDLKKMV